MIGSELTAVKRLLLLVALGGITAVSVGGEPPAGDDPTGCCPGLKPRAKTLERPGLGRALAMLRTGKVTALLVVKLYQLSRSVRDLGDLVETDRLLIGEREIEHGHDVRTIGRSSGCVARHA